MELLLKIKYYSPSGECGHDGQLLTSTIPCISLPNLDLTEHAGPGSQDSADSRQSESPFTTYYSCHDPAFSLASVAAAGPGSRTLSSLSGPGAGGHDSLLEGLGILSPPPVTSVRNQTLDSFVSLITLCLTMYKEMCDLKFAVVGKD